MAEAAELIVIGEVVNVELAGGEIGAGAGEDSFPQMALNTVEVTEVIKGTPMDEVVVGQLSFQRGSDGLREVAVDGVLPSRVGDRVLLFLEQAPNSEWDWEAVSLDGLLWLDGGTVRSTITAGRLGAELNGQLLDVVVAVTVEAS